MDKEFSIEETILYTAFGVMVLAALYASAQKIKGSKLDKYTTIEFEVDNEAVSTTKDSNKFIKNTLKNILAKSNSNVTLIK